MKKLGIDVSYWQGKVDWNEVVNSGIDFAILKCNAGTEIADNFVQNYNGAKSAGLDLGAYIYSYALTEDRAKEEAKACIKTLSGKQLEYPVFFDIEENSVFNLGKAKCSAIVKAFCVEMEDAGFFVGIYASKSHLETYISEELRKRYCVWVAHHSPETTYSGPYDMHQFTDKGTVSGINGYVDMDYCYADYSVIKSKGFNGYKPDSAIPEESKVKATLKTVRKGDSGDYVELAQVLLNIHKCNCGKAGADGKFGSDTEKAVKTFQKFNKLAEDGIVGPKTWAKLLDI